MQPVNRLNENSNLFSSLILIMAYTYKMFLPDDNVISSLACVGDVIVQYDPDAAWDGAEREPLNLLLDLHLLVVATLDRLPT